MKGLGRSSTAPTATGMERLGEERKRRKRLLFLPGHERRSSRPGQDSLIFGLFKNRESRAREKRGKEGRGKGKRKKKEREQEKGREGRALCSKVNFGRKKVTWATDQWPK